MAGRSLMSHGAFVLPWIRPGMRGLDAGCGPGTITLGLANAVFPGQMTGLDLHPAPIARATRLAEGLETVNVSFLRGNACSMPFPDHTFDFVFTHALIEQIADPLAALREIRRALKPDGILAVCCPDWEAYDWSPATPAVERAMFQCRCILSPASPTPAAMLRPWLHQAGFEIATEGTHFESGPSAPALTADFISHLSDHHLPDDARALRNWASLPDAHIRKAWRHAVAVRKA